MTCLNMRQLLWCFGHSPIRQGAGGALQQVALALRLACITRGCVPAMAKHHKQFRIRQLGAGVALLATPFSPTFAAPIEANQPVPGYVAPVTQAPVPEYLDDTRGLYIPSHVQLRAKTSDELARWQPTFMPQEAGVSREAMLNRMATGVANTSDAVAQIGASQSPLNGPLDGQQMAQNFQPQPGVTPVPGLAGGTYAQPRKPQPSTLEGMPSLATGGTAKVPVQMAPQMMPTEPMAVAPMQTVTNGEEIAVGGASAPQALDLQNGIVRLKEERITVRRALQRMLDQVGGAGWTVVWDLDEVNVTLPEMEISLYTEEPFMNVLNALLARLQSRSGQPLRVIKYDNTQRLVITDRASSTGGVGIGPGSDKASGAAVTETVLKESRVSLHYDEVPLVDALENMVNQAGKGQWRLRMYAGTDQVLKPAHIEEPFGIAVERVLKVFNLRYEIFPGGKLVVVTAGDSFGFRGVQ